MVWMKLSDISESQEFAMIHNLPAVVAHVAKNGKELYEELCVARFDMETCFFVTHDNLGERCITTADSDGQIYFFLLPSLSEVNLA
jgi:hypothetical protein